VRELVGKNVRTVAATARRRQIVLIAKVEGADLIVITTDRPP
jgi:hypothetical protein